MKVGLSADEERRDLKHDEEGGGWLVVHNCHRRQGALMGALISMLMGEEPGEHLRRHGGGVG